MKNNLEQQLSWFMGNMESTKMLNMEVNGNDVQSVVDLTVSTSPILSSRDINTEIVAPSNLYKNDDICIISKQLDLDSDVTIIPNHEKFPNEFKTNDSDMLGADDSLWDQLDPDDYTRMIEDQDLELPSSQLNSLDLINVGESKPAYATADILAPNSPLASVPVKSPQQLKIIPKINTIRNSQNYSSNYIETNNSINFNEFEKLSPFVLNSLENIYEAHKKSISDIVCDAMVNGGSTFDTDFLLSARTDIESKIKKIKKLNGPTNMIQDVSNKIPSNEDRRAYPIAAKSPINYLSNANAPLENSSYELNQNQMTIIDDFDDDDMEELQIYKSSQKMPSSFQSNPQPLIPSCSQSLDNYNDHEYKWSFEVKNTLTKIFKLQAFRKHQLEAINAALDGKDVFILMPTGGGKSLCYQLPGCCSLGATRGITIVISPLLSLMQDQVSKLISLGVATLCINSTQDSEQRKFAFSEMARSNPDVKLIYITPEMMVKSAQFQRALLRYIVKAKELKKIDDEIVSFITSKFRNSSGIIYCTSRSKCEDTASKLQKKGLKVAFYHAGLDPNDRTHVQNEWASNNVNIIVATIAFGMGIDKADVRFVIHYSLPQSIEGYYQETGRAGRDGKDSVCLLYYSFRDKHTLESMIDKGDGSRDQKDRQRSNLRQMIAYCENQVECRRQQILAYFGETFDVRDCNKTCDNCESDLQSYNQDVTEESKWIVSLVKDIECDKITMAHAMDVFRGMKHAKIISLGHDRIETYAKGKNWKKQDTERLFRMLIIQQILKERCELNGMGFPMSHLHVGPKSRMPYNQRIILTLTKERECITENLEKKPRKKRVSLSAEDTLDEKNSSETQMQCYRELVQARDQICINNAIDASQVFKDSTLLSMSQKLPKNIAEFLSLPGVDDQRYNYYGGDFLHITKRYSECIPKSINSKKKKVPGIDKNESGYFGPDNGINNNKQRLIRSMSLKM